MEVKSHLFGGAGVIKSYQAAATMLVAGMPVEGAAAGATDIGSVSPIGASAAHQPIVGVTISATGTVSATADEADTLVKVDIRGDQIIRAKASGSSTADTALTLLTCGASALTTTADLVTIDDGFIVGYDGTNAGALRRADDAIGGVNLSWDTAPTASTDRFIVGQGYPAAATSAIHLDLTTDLTQIDSSSDITDTDTFVIVEMDFPSSMSGIHDATTNTFYILGLNSAVFGGFAGIT